MSLRFTEYGVLGRAGTVTEPTLIIDNNSNPLPARDLMPTHITHAKPYSAGVNFRRQILTSKVDHRTVRAKIFIMAVGRYSTEPERTNQDSYDYLQLKKPPLVFKFVQN